MRKKLMKSDWFIAFALFFLFPILFVTLCRVLCFITGIQFSDENKQGMIIFAVILSTVATGAVALFRFMERNS